MRLVGAAAVPAFDSVKVVGFRSRAGVRFQPVGHESG